MPKNDPFAALSGVRALIVDDDATSRELLRTQLRSWNMRPTEAQAAAPALQALYQALGEGDPFGVALIDQQMPGMDGEALGRAIRADTRLVGTRLVLLVSLGMRGDVQRSQPIGFSGYVIKPARTEDLHCVLVEALAERAQTAPAEALELPSFAGREARVLQADDNLTNQQVALGILERLGLSADAVANGREAIRALEVIPYDLVLMDVQMPEMDGIEATRRIRERGLPSRDHAPASSYRNLPGARRAVPIIAMTACTMQGVRERCLAAGMDDDVAKPVDAAELSKMLAKWLPQRGNARRTPSRSADTAPKPDAVVFDYAGLLDRLMDSSLARKVARAFLEDAPQQIAALDRYLDAKDMKGAERQAHTLKGAAAVVGGERLRAIAFALERSIRAGDLETPRGHQQELQGELDRLKNAMRDSGLLEG